MTYNAEARRQDKRVPVLKGSMTRGEGRAFTTLVPLDELLLFRSSAGLRMTSLMASAQSSVAVVAVDVVESSDMLLNVDIDASNKSNSSSLKIKRSPS